MDDAARWRLIDEERQRLGEVLQALEPDKWGSQTLCGNWDVRQTVAHLSAAGSTGTGGWLANMVRSGFDTNRHNERLLTRNLSQDWQETLARYQSLSTSRVAPLGSVRGMLGEVLVHGQDIARPLEIELMPSIRAVREVAEFFAAKNFAVNSKTMIKDISLIAVDDEFTTGSGPEVRGSLLDLVMAMAGRGEVCSKLEGSGVAILVSRIR
ncbi:maleylpyruvate isomerase family mycothiol-dependent enzyme [Glutamicibacter uratoxydans]|uniref:maleylpyruvate isomerase family mycothiol-dependent enzyme n=1 Tax=Glutamicibacter uratoxydans TaxID=43667 RepID=UPI003D6DF567